MFYNFKTELDSRLSLTANNGQTEPKDIELMHNATIRTLVETAAKYMQPNIQPGSKFSQKNSELRKKRRKLKATTIKIQVEEAELNNLIKKATKIGFDHGLL